MNDAETEKLLQSVSNTTPAEVIAKQHARIAKAAGILKTVAESMIDSIDPDECKWSDVGKFADIAELADRVIERFDSR